MTFSTLSLGCTKLNLAHSLSYCLKKLSTSDDFPLKVLGAPLDLGKGRSTNWLRGSVDGSTGDGTLGDGILGDGRGMLNCGGGGVALPGCIPANVDDETPIYDAGLDALEALGEFERDSGIGIPLAVGSTDVVPEMSFTLTGVFSHELNSKQPKAK